MKYTRHRQFQNLKSERPLLPRSEEMIEIIADTNLATSMAVEILHLDFSTLQLSDLIGHNF
jgi:hypothetical protein